ncbi:CHASE3 domain-containing protein [Rhizobium sp. S163]|uniref:adenylate/guanylate cyclase domain-containing protein n=1 Tax=Rhizobium sp. S163 TaxID=3055039 RepID=UPI0025A99585|nr:CHASE3 domain-containing protein [Rhizobium sp. S163]MDM9646820.1 CHASE3 domain-containing protein [Rhizobium sp. S163]
MSILHEGNLPWGLKIHQLAAGKLRSRRATRAVNLLVVVGVIAVIYLTVSISAHDRQVEQKVRDTIANQSAISEIRSLLQDAEIGQRGYLLTGDELYLDPYSEALPTVGLAVDGLAKRTADDAFQVANISNLRSLIAQKLSELKQSVDHRRRGDLDGAKALLATGQGKIIMDGIRSVLRQMTDEEAVRLAERSRLAQAGKTWIEITMAGLATLSGGMALFALNMATGRAREAERTRDELLTRFDRRLMAVMAADLVGYSRLMERDEATTLSKLKVAREAIDEIIVQQGGMIVNTAGDSVVAAFPSALSAVDCAVDIQETMRLNNVQVPEGEQLQFRIGLNVGDVIVENGDIFGDTVNIAARLEGIADAGGICISRAVRDHVRKHRNLKFVDGGFQQVKNIARPVSTFHLRQH